MCARLTCPVGRFLFDNKPRTMRDKRKEDRYIKERVIKRKSIRKAAKAAGIGVATAARAEADPRIKSEMAKALDKAGATKDKIAEVVARNLDAQKVISANIVAKNGEGMADAHSMTKDFVEVPDGPTQLKAAELCGKFRGDFVERHEHELGPEAKHSLKETMDWLRSKKP